MTSQFAERVTTPILTGLRGHPGGQLPDALLERHSGFETQAGSSSRDVSVTRANITFAKRVKNLRFLIADLAA